MHHRCNNPQANKYHLYGGKGVRVCPEWQEYSAFKAWALANGYDDSLTIDRKDGNGDYCPGNCWWATFAEQARNTISNVWVEAFGERKTVTDWRRDERSAVGNNAYYYRVRKGWSPFDALFTPACPGHPKKDRT